MGEKEGTYMYVCVFSSACHVPVELQGRSASHDPRLWLWRPIKASKMLPCYAHVPVCSIITHVVLELFCGVRIILHANVISCLSTFPHRGNTGAAVSP